MTACTPFAFQMGAWSATGFGAALLLGAYIRAKWRSVQALPGAEQTFEEEEGMEQLSLLEALERRDAVLATVEANNKNWTAKAIVLYESLPPADGDETGEDIRMRLTAAGLEEPRRGGWGGLTNALIRRGAIKWSGAVRPMKSDKAHGKKTFVYERTTIAEVPGAIVAVREREPA